MQISIKNCCLQLSQRNIANLDHATLKAGSIIVGGAITSLKFEAVAEVFAQAFPFQSRNLSPKRSDFADSQICCYALGQEAQRGAEVTTHAPVRLCFTVIGLGPDKFAQPPFRPSRQVIKMAAACSTDF